MKPLAALLLFTMWSASASSQRAVSTLVFSDYSRKTKMTTYSVLPMGSVSFPGKWRRGNTYSASGQTHFSLGDSLRTAVAINRALAYPFYKKGLGPDALVSEMYNWDSKYIEEQTGQQNAVVKTDTVNHFIVWKTLASDPTKYNEVMYLFGLDHGVIYNLNIVADRWDDERKLAFLEAMFATRKTGNCCEQD